MYRVLNNGSRKDFYLICTEKNREFVAYYVDYNRQTYEGTACKYKSLLNVVKFAKKNHFKLYKD